MNIRSIKEIKNLKNKRVLLRVDFNVPIKNGKVLDDYKIQKSLPTIKYLLKKGAAIVIVSHLGRPRGVEKKLTLAPVARQLEKLLGELVRLKKIKRLEDLKINSSSNKKGIVMLENIRFLAGEEKNDPGLAKALATLADIFVLDGFGVSHRAAASVSGVAKYLPSYAGLLLMEEVEVLSRVMNKPKRPLTVILGGAKVETKFPILKNLLPKADHILVGGGIGNTYLWATGHAVGKSLIDKEFKNEIIKYCRNKKVVTPVDVLLGEANGKNARVVQVKDLKSKIISGKLAIYDIGPQTVQLFSQYIKKAETLIYNGALGMFEQHPYEFGTDAVTQLFASRSKGQAFGVCGGGETNEILRAMNLFADVDFVSTGGGAMLEFLAGNRLPGIEALKK